jgi:hypothetical protein
LRWFERCSTSSLALGLAYMAVADDNAIMQGIGRTAVDAVLRDPVDRPS